MKVAQNSRKGRGENEGQWNIPAYVTDLFEGYWWR
jgi:hypothetical protein